MTDVASASSVKNAHATRTAMDAIVTIPLDIALGLYIVWPVLLWIMGVRLLPVEWETLEPNAPLPAHVEPHFSEAAAVLSTNGFDRAGDRVCETIRSGWCAHVELWRNSRTGEAAYVSTQQKGQGDAFCKHFVVFLHESDTGALITTSSFDWFMRSNLAPAGALTLNAPSLDILRLRALHNGHIRTLERSARSIRMRDGLTLCQALDASTRAAALAQKRFRACGDSLRITLWGAFYAVWINLPPFRLVESQRNRRKYNRARAALVVAASVADRAA